MSQLCPLILLTLEDSGVFLARHTVEVLQVTRQDPRGSPQHFGNSCFSSTPRALASTPAFKDPGPWPVQPHAQSLPSSFQCRMRAPWQQELRPLEEPEQTLSWSEWKAPSSDGSCRCRSRGRRSSIDTRCSVRWLAWLHQDPAHGCQLLGLDGASGQFPSLSGVFPSKARGIYPPPPSLEVSSTVITRECGWVAGL